MWRTPQGERVLTGSEGAAFKTALAVLVEELAEWGDEPTTGVRAFDTLSYGQRLATLEDVARALFDSEVAAPVHTAANEAAVYAVFQQLRTLVELEGTTGGRVRRLVRAACKERGLHAPTLRDKRSDEWDWAVDSLSDEILWDHDFADGDEFLDALPEEDVTRKMLGIPNDYYCTVPRELREAEVEPAIARLRAFAG